MSSLISSLPRQNYLKSYSPSSISQLKRPLLNKKEETKEPDPSPRFFQENLSSSSAFEEKDNSPNQTQDSVHSHANSPTPILITQQDEPPLTQLNHNVTHIKEPYMCGNLTDARFFCTLPVCLPATFFILNTLITQDRSTFGFLTEYYHLGACIGTSALGAAANVGIECFHPIEKATESEIIFTYNNVIPVQLATLIPIAINMIPFIADSSFIEFNKNGGCLLISAGVFTLTKCAQWTFFALTKKRETLIEITGENKIEELNP